MRSSGLLIIILALFVGYLGVTGKYPCFGIFIQCLSQSQPTCSCTEGSQPSVSNTGQPATTKLSSSIPNYTIPLTTLDLSTIF